MRAAWKYLRVPLMALGAFELVMLGFFIASPFAVPTKRIALLILASLVGVVALIAAKGNLKRWVGVMLYAFGVIAILSLPAAIRGLRNSRSTTTRNTNEKERQSAQRLAALEMCPPGLLASVGDNVYGALDRDSLLSEVRAAESGNMRSFKGLVLSQKILRLSPGTLTRITGSEAYPGGLACQVDILDNVPQVMMNARVFVPASGTITALPTGARIIEWGSLAKVLHPTIAYSNWTALEKARAEALGSNTGNISNVLAITKGTLVEVENFKIFGRWIGYKVTTDTGPTSWADPRAPAFWIDGDALGTLPSSDIIMSSNISESVLADKPIPDGTLSPFNSYGKITKGPVPVYTPNPSYTKEARAAGLRGTIEFRILIGTRGNVTVLDDITPLGLGLDESATKTIEKWKFRPALLNDGTPVAWWQTTSVHFPPTSRRSKTETSTAHGQQFGLR